MATRRRVIVGAGAAVAAGAAWAVFGGPSYDDAAAAVWSPRQAGGRDDLDYLVHYATLAANSHNTQPWTFRRTGAGVSISPDLSRATPAVDPDHHHIYVSLGCAAENLMLAARAAGADPGVAFSGTNAEIALGDATSVRDPLFDAILERQSTRSDYDGRTVPPDELRALEKAAAVDGCRLILETGRPRIEEALELVIAANTRQVEDPAFREELLSWLRFSAREAVSRRDGLFSGCSGNPQLPDWLGRLVFPLVFKTAGENDRYARQIRSSAGLAVFVSEADDAAHWFAAGRACQRFMLKAAALGIRCAFVNQPVEIAAIRPQFAGWLGAGDRRPDLVLRYGYAPAMPRSLRRPVAAVIA